MVLMMLMLVLMLSELIAMHFLAESLHQVLLRRLIKCIMGASIRWETRRCGHGVVAVSHGNLLLGMGPCESHHPLDPFDVGLVLFTLLLLALASFTLGSLRWGTGLEFTRDEFQVVGNLDAALEEEELQVARLVFKLDLVAILQRFADGASGPKHGENLAPMGSLNPVQTGHERIFLLGRPGSTLAGKARFAAARGRLGGGGHARPFVKDLGRLGLRVVGNARHVTVVGRSRIRSSTHVEGGVIVLLEVGLEGTLLKGQLPGRLLITRRRRARLVLLMLRRLRRRWAGLRGGIAVGDMRGRLVHWLLRRLMVLNGGRVLMGLLRRGLLVLLRLVVLLWLWLWLLLWWLLALLGLLL